MSWSLSIGRAFGIPLRVHLTFLLIVAFGAYKWGAAHGLAGAGFGVALTLLLFVGVLLHELGHSLVARHFGIPVLEIVLLPIGGIAALGAKPERPRHELLIALAGPLVNLGIAMVLGAVLFGLLGAGMLNLELVKSLTPSWSTLLVLLLVGNLTLGLFNLLPIFPMDGGRVLRALLASRFGATRATRWAAGFGQVAAVGLGIFAIVGGHFFLALIAGMVFLAAGRERFEASVAGALRELTARDACEVPSVLLEPGDRIATALRASMRTPQTVFPIVLGGELLGVVDRADLAIGARTVGAEAYVLSVARRDVVRVPADMPLDQVLEALRRQGAPLALVEDDGVPIGFVTHDRLNTSVMLAADALGGERRTARRAEPEYPG